MSRPLLVSGAFVALSLTLALQPARAAAPLGAPALAELSLEQLSEVVVSTVSRREERLDRVAASVFVISGDDIRRSGATTLPEALRLAPQLQIARADANQYAITARGFGNVLANRMLVLIDGRTVYTPLFSGVFWEAQDVMLEDVERIEVISGPSTALWGSNAVNGLIHVITRPASSTQGAALSLSGGADDKMGEARWGGTLGDRGRYRVYAKSYDRANTEMADGQPVRDQADGTQVGFRTDWNDTGDAVTLQGDAYRSAIDQAPSARKISGFNVVGRWQRNLADGAQLTLQAYVDHTLRDQPGTIRDSLETYDVVAQCGRLFAERHQVVAGVGLRHSRDDVENGPTVGFLPPDRNLTWSRVFATDQIALTERLDLTLSGSLEHNPYTGWEGLPSLRLGYRIGERSLLWAAASRAVRAPSRVDRELLSPVQPPFVLAGGPEFRSEVSNVFELGWRAQPTPGLSAALTLFDYEHQSLRSIEATPTGLQFRNGITGRTYGAQAWVQWRATDRWRLVAGGTALHQDLHAKDGVALVGGTAQLGNDPPVLWALRSEFDFDPRLSWHLDVRHVGALPDPAVPAYTAVDTRLAWRLPNDVELAVVGKNLFDPRHAEWGPASNRVEFQRALWFQVRWRL